MRKALVFLAVLFWIPGAWALEVKELGRQEVKLAFSRVESASLFEEPWLEAPWPTTVITRKDLQVFGWYTLGQVLDYQPSFYRLQNFHTRPFSFRGVAFAEMSGLLFLADGFRLNSPGLENFFPEWNFPLWGASRIEIVRGSGTSLYGDAALTGVVSLTERGESCREAGALWGEGGRGGGWVNLRKGGIRFLAAYYDKKEGELRVPASQDLALNPAPGVKPLEEVKDNYLVEAGLEHGGLSLLYRRFRFWESGAVTFLGENLRPEDIWDLTPYRKNVEDFWGLTYNFGRKGLKGRFKAYFLRAREESGLVSASLREFPEVFFSRGLLPANTFAEYDFRRYGMEAWLEKGSQESRFLFGGKVEQTNYHLFRVRPGLHPVVWSWLSAYLGRSLTLPSPSYTFKFPDHREELYALFGSWRKALGKRWLFNLGVRFEHFEAFGSELAPRLSFIYRLQPETSLVFTYSRAYQSVPYIFRLWQKKMYHEAESSLQKSETLEISLRHADLRGRFFSINLFYLETKDFLRLAPRYVMFVPRNLGEWGEWGGELEAHYEGLRFKAFFNYSFLDVLWSRKRNNPSGPIYGRRIAGIPRWMLKAGGAWRLSFRPEVWLSLAVRQYGRTLYRQSRKELWTSPYLLMDLNLLVEFEGWALNLKVANLFDQEYRLSGFLPPYPQPGRSFLLRLEKRF